ncbi:hypothetical protein HHK36_020758 [Tetracentron sinense]|uniref:Uncharacterized protein n=1 Tax=Tetracentron sinense TaxID=13715 RepID=A0A835DBC1_TETSI|nr:hypothetical protein HHK36_020758 [Tetracentron sinense]
MNDWRVISFTGQNDHFVPGIPTYRKMLSLNLLITRAFNDLLRAGFILTKDAECESADAKKQVRGSTSARRALAAESYKASILDKAIEYLKSLQLLLTSAEAWSIYENLPIERVSEIQLLLDQFLSFDRLLFKGWNLGRKWFSFFLLKDAKFESADAKKQVCGSTSARRALAAELDKASMLDEAYLKSLQLQVQIWRGKKEEEMRDPMVIIFWQYYHNNRAKHQDFDSMLIGAVDAPLDKGRITFYKKPNLHLALTERNLKEALSFKMRTKGFNMLPGSVNISFTWKLGYKLLNTIAPILPSSPTFSGLFVQGDQRGRLFVQGDQRGRIMMPLQLKPKEINILKSWTLGPLRPDLAQQRRASSQHKGVARQGR